MNSLQQEVARYSSEQTHPTKKIAPISKPPRFSFVKLWRAVFSVHSKPGQVKPGKRRYYNLLSPLRDIAFILKQNPYRLLAVLRKVSISSAFRERLMLAVTGVNECSACTYIHSTIALTEGITQADIDLLLSGDFTIAPEHEIPALLYAQSWAEADAKPCSASKQALATEYGKALANEIEIVLHMIRLGNLTGNSFEFTVDTILSKFRKA